MKRGTAVSPYKLELINSVRLAACRHFSISMEELLSAHALTEVRQMCFYIISRADEDIPDDTIGLFFNRKRTAVRYGIDLIDHHKEIYRQVLGNLNGMIEIANNFEKKYQWHIPWINITR